MEADPEQEKDTLVNRAVRANIRFSSNHLRHGSEVLERLILNDGLMVVGAEYSLESGEVDFFDMPQRRSSTFPAVRVDK